MSKCRYDLSKDCNNTDCLACVLGKIRAEVTAISDHIDKLVEQYEDTDLIKAKYVKQIIDNHLTAEELDEIKAAEFERGYRYGINSVITNMQRFLKEITP